MNCRRFYREFWVPRPKRRFPRPLHPIADLEPLLTRQALSTSRRSGNLLARLSSVFVMETTSWSRTKYLNPINALFGVAYGTRNVISPLLVVRNLSVDLSVIPRAR